MARARKLRCLAVWMNGERVGYWRTPPGGRQEFDYAASWLDSPRARPISLSLPLRAAGEPYRGERVEFFFDNLLPDNRQIRERIQLRFRVPRNEAFDLLHAIGQDCVGALQILPEEATPDSIHRIVGEPLTREEVGGVLNQVAGLRMAEVAPNAWADFRISLAGAQEKTALLWHAGGWWRPRGPTPTTHILKLPMGISPQGIDLSTSVENEWLCGQILRAFGVPTAASRMEIFGDFKALVVERFDRRLSEDGSYWLRVPQEDLCQATATASACKYEPDGGPGSQRILELLQGSEHAAADRRDFLRTQVVFWLLAAIDGHAKNFSLFLRPGGAYHLTPRYDVLSAYPVLGHGRGLLARQKIKMAMAVSGKSPHYHWAEIRRRHWLATAERCGLPGMPGILDELCAETPQVLATVRGVLPPGFPEPLADAILRGLQAAAVQLASAAE